MNFVTKTAQKNTEGLLNQKSLAKRDAFLLDFRNAYEILKEGMAKDPNNPRMKTLFNGITNMFWYTLELETDKDSTNIENLHLKNQIVELKIKVEELLLIKK